jgi:hypothetical protein
MTFQRIGSCVPTSTTSGTAEPPCLIEPLPLGAGPYVLAQGQIERQSAEALATVASDLPKGTTLVLQSSGGDLLGGLMLGQYIRAREFNTYVADEGVLNAAGVMNPSFFKKCISSCAYTFLGGIRRGVGVRAQLGVHQFRSKDKNLDPIQTQKIAATLGKYMDTMNVSRNLLDLALMTDPGRVSLIGEQNRKSWRVETEEDAAASVANFWKIETSTGGKKLAYQSKQQLASRAIVTVAITPLNGQVKLLLIVKPDATQESNPSWFDFFSQRTDLELRVNSQVFTLKADSDWMRAGQVNTQGTRQIWYPLTPQVLITLAGANAFALQPLWHALPSGLDTETIFATTGLSELLKNAL